jgi:hypothetical protein
LYVEGFGGFVEIAGGFVDPGLITLTPDLGGVSGFVLAICLDAFLSAAFLIAAFFAAAFAANFAAAYFSAAFFPTVALTTFLPAAPANALAAAAAAIPISGAGILVSLTVLL